MLGWILMTPLVSLLLIVFTTNPPKKGQSDSAWWFVYFIFTLFLIGLGLLIGGKV